MNVYKSLLIFVLGFLGLLVFPISGDCSTPPGSATESPAATHGTRVSGGSKETPVPGISCGRLEKELRAHRQEVSRELRQVKRELARLRAELAEPGIREIMAGTGYILGLFGIAAFVLSRKRPR